MSYRPDGSYPSNNRESLYRETTKNSFQAKKNSFYWNAANNSNSVPITMLVVMTIVEMNKNINSINTRGRQPHLSNGDMEYKSPDPKNIGFLERWGIKNMLVKNEVIAGIPVEVTYHPRSGRRSVAEITGGPRGILGLTSTPTDKGPNWDLNAKREIESLIEDRLLKSMTMPIDNALLQKVAEGKFKDATIKVQNANSAQNATHFFDDDSQTALDDLRCEKSRLDRSSNIKRNELMLNRHRLAVIKIDQENTSWKHNQKRNSPNKRFPNEIEESISKNKNQIENLEFKKKKIERLINSDQKEKDEIDSRRKEIERGIKPQRNPTPATVHASTPPPNSNKIGSKVGKDFKNGTKLELQRQLENASTTVGNAVGTGLITGGARVYQLMQNDDASLGDVAKVIGDTAYESSLTTVKNVGIAVLWEGSREVVEQNLPQVSEYIPNLGTAVKVSQLANAVYHSNDSFEIADHVAGTALDITLQATCTKIGTVVGGAVGTFAGPGAGTYVGAVAGGAVGTGAYMAVRYGINRGKEMKVFPSSFGDLSRSSATTAACSHNATRARLGE
jgi:hypothetical protein